MHAPGILKTAILLTLCVYTTSDEIRTFWDIVGDVNSSQNIYLLCGPPSAHVSPLVFTHLFYLIKFISRKAPLFCLHMRVSGSMPPR